MTESRARPELYTVGGAVQAGEGLYIPRRADAELIEVCRRGAFAYILYTRQVGKSSLMEHASRELANQGIRSALIDLSQIGKLVEAEAWYLGLLVEIADQLELETDVLGWWREHLHLGITHRLSRFFQQHLLVEIESPVVICVDEIDTTLKLGFTDDFFAVIRSLYHGRSRAPQLRRLSFVLAGVATPNDLIQDPQRTPFNIGEAVHLSDFDAEEAAPLAAGLGPPPDEARETLGWILRWTGGHPYLTQRVCRLVAEQDRARWTRKEIDRLVAAAFFGRGAIRDPNLQFVRDMLTKQSPDVSAVLRIYRHIRRGKRVFDDEKSVPRAHLKLAGVVRGVGGLLEVRNPIYHKVFDEAWIREHLPVDWRRRLRAAALGLMIIFFVLSIPTTWFALSQRDRAREQAAAAAAQYRRAETERARAEAASAEARKQRKLAEASALRAIAARDDALEAREAERRLRRAAEQSAQRERELRERAEEAEREARAAQKEPTSNASWRRRREPMPSRRRNASGSPVAKVWPRPTSPPPDASPPPRWPGRSSRAAAREHPPGDRIAGALSQSRGLYQPAPQP